MKKLIVILVILTIILIALSAIWKNDQNISESIKIIYDNKEYVLPINDLENYNKIDFKAGNKNRYTGYSFYEILDSLQITSFSIIIFHSIDGGKLTLERSKFEKLYFIIQEGDKAQHIRLMIPEEKYKQRCMKYISTIELQ
ncbi:MAG: hypothetical protein K8R49_06940 [Candidatus Cloacimonetes bacterium]|nr:hypothetical protein [Candidatus Cloacimonadota bacterium]